MLGVLKPYKYSFTLHYIMLQEKSTKTSLCLVDVEKLNINAVRQSDGDLKINFSLQSVTVDDTRLDSTLAIRRYSELCLSTDWAKR